MHPIERLRYVARSDGGSAAAMVRETAMAMGTFVDDPHGLVTACRRLVTRQPRSGPLVWLAARLLSGDARAEARRAVREIEDDATAAELSHALPDDATVVVLGWPELIGDALLRRGDLEVLLVDANGETSGFARRLAAADLEVVDVRVEGIGSAVAAADVVLLEAAVVGPTACYAIAGSRSAAAVARHAGVAVWLVAGVGRVLPERLWHGVVEGGEVTRDPWDTDDELVPLDLVDVVIGPKGRRTVAEMLQHPDCAAAPELLRAGIH